MSIHIQFSSRLLINLLAEHQYLHTLSRTTGRHGCRDGLPGGAKVARVSAQVRLRRCYLSTCGYLASIPPRRARDTSPNRTHVNAAEHKVTGEDLYGVERTGCCSVRSRHSTVRNIAPRGTGGWYRTCKGYVTLVLPLRTRIEASYLVGCHVNDVPAPTRLSASQLPER